MRQIAKAETASHVRRATGPAIFSLAADSFMSADDDLFNYYRITELPINNTRETRATFTGKTGHVAIQTNLESQFKTKNAGAALLQSTDPPEIGQGGPPCKAES